jgi:molybdopterin converting factor small subunit
VPAGGSIEDVPRGTTAGQILREKGVFAIVDGTATAASSSSDSDADVASEALTLSASTGSSSSSSSSSSASGRSKGGRARLQAQQQQQQQVVEGVSSVGSAQLVNVNNRLVSEDTVLRDGDLVILAREKIKI